MRVNRQLTSLCRRFAASGLKVTERRRDTYRETVERSVACDHWHVKFTRSNKPEILVYGEDYVIVGGFANYVVTISIYNDILELIIN